jgi:glycosyltransferase involved in cell wall biosynthesis
MDDLVSVIVPTYNRAYCICRTIDGVLQQTHQNWELVVVDDGSKDNTAELIASKYGDEPRVRYLYQPNAGVSAARNTGINAAHGNFVAFLDSDDVWRPWKLEVQLACFRSFPNVGMVWTNFAGVNSVGKVVNERHLTKMYGAYRFFPSLDQLFECSRALADVIDLPAGIRSDARVYVGNIYTSMLRGNLVHTSTVMVSRTRIENVKGFDEELKLSGEDYDFHFRTSKWGPVCFIDVSSMNYQLDFDDRLSAHSRRVSENFLKTVENAITREEGNGQFPPSMIRDVLSEAHVWIAEEFLKEKNLAEVRRHAFMSLRYRPRHSRQVSLLAIALVPHVIAEPILKGYRSCKSMIFSAKKA